MNKRIWLLAGAALLAWHAGVQAAATNLLDLAQWQVYGTKSLQGGTLTIGDNVGYDPSDRDHDGNPYNVWYEGSTTAAQGVDYDDAVTVSEFTAPLTLTWTGCFPVTQYGYNNIVLGKANPNFTGTANSRQYMIQQEIGFSTRWDYGAKLNTFVSNDVTKVDGATPSNNTFCADYKIVWANDKVQFYYNGAKIREQSYAYSGPVKLVVRSFERPHTITAMTMDTGTATPQAPATSQGVGMIQGANLSGSLTDASGRVTPLSSSNTGVAGDLTFAFNAAGGLLAHISGTIASAGMAFGYEVDYDVTTQNLSGTYADNKDKVPHSITFTNKGGYSWQGRVQGTGYGQDGKSQPYDIAFDIVLPQEAITMGTKFPTNGRFNVNLGRTETVSIPINIPELGIINQTFSTSVITEGSLVASLVPGSSGFTLTGTVEGGVRMDPPVVVTGTVNVPVTVPGYTIPPVTVTINIDATGHFSGVLTGNTAQNNMKFVGNWSSVSSSGATGGGTLEMAIPMTATGQLPQTALLLMKGTIKAPVDTSSLSLPAGVPLPSTVPTSVEQAISNQITIPLVFN